MVALLNNLWQPYTNADRAGDTVLINEYVAGEKQAGEISRLDEIQTKSTAAFCAKIRPFTISSITARKGS